MGAGQAALLRRAAAAHRDRRAGSEARETIAAFEGCETIVVNAAGCGSAMKDYGHLFRDDPDWGERAAAFSAKVRDVHELLAEHEPQAAAPPGRPRRRLPRRLPPRPRPGRPRAAARAAARRSPASSVREPAEWELCCGSAGVWNLLNPEPAAELGQRKARNLLATGAQAVAAANPGCALQIGVHAGLPVHHPMDAARRLDPWEEAVTVDVLAPAPAAGVLTDDALAFLGALHERFEPRRRELLDARAQRARADRRGRDARLPARDARHPRGRLAGRPRAARPAGPARGDHRPGRPQDGHQRAELGRARLHGRLRGLAVADLGQRRRRARST